jgi:hypothetical protein
MTNAMVQTESVLNVLKVILAALSVVFLFAFFIQWKLSKYRLPVIAFYTKKRFVKHNIVLGTGIVALSLAYITEFVCGYVRPADPVGGLVVNALEVVSLICIGYSYYKLMRLDMPA